MMDEQWAREHIGITPAVEEATEGVAMLALQIRRAMAEERISVTLPQNWVMPVLADRDKLEAENTELRAQLEAQRGEPDLWVYHHSPLTYDVFEDRETAESIARTGLGELIPVWKAPQRGGAVAVPPWNRSDFDKVPPEWPEMQCFGAGYDLAVSRIRPIPASQVLQPGMVGVDAGVLELLGIFFDQRISVEWEPEKVECDDLNRWAKEARKAVQEYRAQQSKGGDDVR